MRFEIITPFPAMFDSVFSQSIVKRAVEAEVVQIETIDLRKFTTDKHSTVDDYQFGGGPGMVMKPEPLFKAVEFLLEGAVDKPPIILLSAKGDRFDQKKAEVLSLQEHLILVCGHYKGVDQRFIDYYVTEEISLGDYVLSGGEIPAMVIVDTVVRLLPGAISDPESASTDSFSSELLEGPIYTRPEVYRGLKVPPVLLSGHHKKIEAWRQEQALLTTQKRRPDLLKAKNESAES